MPPGHGSPPHPPTHPPYPWPWEEAMGAGTAQGLHYLVPHCFHRLFLQRLNSPLLLCRFGLVCRAYWKHPDHSSRRHSPNPVLDSPPQAPFHPTRLTALSHSLALTLVLSLSLSKIKQQQLSFLLLIESELRHTHPAPPGRWPIKEIFPVHSTEYTMSSTKILIDICFPFSSLSGHDIP